jgi:hypothetical protein
MRGPAPKAAELRQRRNRTPGTAMLGGGARKVPPLPKGLSWHKMTISDWRHWWRSPMSSQWLDGDMPALYRLIELVNRYWWAVENQRSFNRVRVKDLESLDISPVLAEFLYELSDVVNKLAQDIGKGIVMLAAEIRQEETRFGLTPIDRRRLAWEIGKDEPKPAVETTEDEDDPRLGLRLVQTS